MAEIYKENEEVTDALSRLTLQRAKEVFFSWAR
jgi:hypothetical protein